MKIQIKKLNEKAIIPKRAKPSDAGMDLTATSYTFENDRHIYGTGLAIRIPEGHVGLIFPRSSICKYNQRLTNSVGVIDAGYLGEIKFVFENIGMDNSKPVYDVGERIGQLIVIPYPEYSFEEVEDLGTSDRGTGGFGSSGT